ncbi:MAG: response regulator [Nitrospiraceae bacterium]|nr:response regulator [Nitrospiraceae bacterium]
MAKQSILVIDDDLIWHKLLKRLFEELGYNVHTAATCADGVRQAEQHKPDCIILDFHLTDGDAVSVCAALKKSKDSAKIPVIIFSSDPCAEITAYAECRAAYFVLKGGSSVTDLPMVIKSVLALTEQRNLIIEA